MNDSARAPRILFVCTGNICRSPMAQYLLAAKATAVGLALTVRSAGFAAPDQSMPKHALNVLKSSGIDGSAHRSTRITADHLHGADVVLTMTGRHTTEAAVLDFDAVPWIYTLREFRRRATFHGPRPAEQSLRDYAAEVGGDRTPAALAALGGGDDIADPYGRRRGAYKAAIREIETEIDALAPTLFSRSFGAAPD